MERPSRSGRMAAVSAGLTSAAAMVRVGDWVSLGQRVQRHAGQGSELEHELRFAAVGVLHGQGGDGGDGHGIGILCQDSVQEHFGMADGHGGHVGDGLFGRRG